VRTARDSTTAELAPVPLLILSTSLTCSLHALSTLSSWVSAVNSSDTLIADVDTHGLTTATDDEETARCDGDSDRSVMSAAAVSASVLAMLTLSHIRGHSYRKLTNQYILNNDWSEVAWRVDITAAKTKTET